MCRSQNTFSSLINSCMSLFITDEINLSYNKRDKPYLSWHLYVYPTMKNSSCKLSPQANAFSSPCSFSVKQGHWEPTGLSTLFLSLSLGLSLKSFACIRIVVLLACLLRAKGDISRTQAREVRKVEEAFFPFACSPHAPRAPFKKITQNNRCLLPNKIHWPLATAKWINWIIWLN